MNDELEDIPTYFQSRLDKYNPSNYSQIHQIRTGGSINNRFAPPQSHSYSGWATIMKHCKVFCETTSLRGIPRIAKTSEPKRRFLWIFFVTAFFLACITCIVLLVMQYRQYDVIHQPKTVYNQPRPFPSLTFCNLRPLSSYSIKMLKNSGLRSVTEYLKHLKNSMRYLRYKVNEREQKLLTMSWNINSYFLNLPNSTMPNDLGHDKMEMVMTCILVYKDGIYTSGIICDRAGRWVLTLNSIFLNCHTFIVDKNYSDRTFHIEIVLYLDNHDEVYCHDCLEMSMASQLTGVRLNLHGSGTYPEINEKGINLMPGTLTEIKFIPREWRMMEPPHGNCGRNVSEKISFNKIEFKYSEEACKMKVLQEELAKNCDCIDFNQIPDELFDFLPRRKICKYLPYSPFSNQSLKYLNFSQVDGYLKKANCELKTSSKLKDELTKCNSPCVFHTYDTTISSAEWPTKTYHAAFLKSLKNIIQKKKNVNIKNSTNSTWNTIIDELNPYLALLKKIDQGIDIKKNKKLLNELKFVSNNFLSIQVGRANFDIILVEEKATVSLTNFLSQTGGIFSIWSGITFFCIVEIFELLILIIDEIMSNKKSSNPRIPSNC